MKKWMLTGLALLLALMLAACGGETTPPAGGEEGDTQQTEGTLGSDDASTNDNGAEEENQVEAVPNYTVEIEVQDFGTITAELDGSAAPITVANFAKLAESGFYDGLTFHRVMSGFMIQGGDPLGNGTGGSAETIKGEFSENGVDNPLKHTRGALSMARSKANDSASSQFFIVHEDSDFLDGKYAAFGYVTSGIEVVDAICEKMTELGYKEAVAAEDQPVITAIRVLPQE